MTGTRRAGRPATPDVKAKGAAASGAPSLYELVSAASLDGFVASSGDQRLLGCNERLFELWGIGPEEQDEVRRLGETVEARSALVRLFSARTATPFVRAGARDPLATRIDELPLLDGRVLERYAVPTFAPDGARVGRIAFFRDITRRTRAEGEPASSRRSPPSASSP
jgi:PAS domain-containing protein